MPESSFLKRTGSGKWNRFFYPPTPLKNYLVTTRLPDEPDEAFMLLIPKQRALVDLLLERGVIKSYSLSADRTMLWIVFHADSEIRVIKLLQTFPLISYMKPEITELMFHNTSVAGLGQPSLN